MKPLVRAAFFVSVRNQDLQRKALILCWLKFIYLLMFLLFWCNLIVNYFNLLDYY